MLYTKCIKAPPDVSDGVRISVMSLHTLNDGKTPDPDIMEYMYSIHNKLLAPSQQLVGDYYKRGISWEEYERRYLEEIREEPKLNYVWELVDRALELDVTIMCIEETPEHCHRRLLAEECQRLNPRLQILCR